MRLATSEEDFPVLAAAVDMRQTRVIDTQKNVLTKFCISHHMFNNFAVALYDSAVGKTMQFFFNATLLMAPLKYVRKLSNLFRGAPAMKHRQKFFKEMERVGW